MDNIHPDDRLRLLRAKEAAQKTGEVFECEHRIQVAGNTRWVLSRAVPLRGSAEGITEWVVAVTDITARRHLEEELQRHRGLIDDRVIERTAQLDEANGALRDEILERTRAEREHLETLRRLARAQEDERRRLSRELHDNVGQMLGALLLDLNALGSAPSDEARAAKVQHLRATVRTITDEVHNLAVELRPPVLDDLGLCRALNSYIESWSARTTVKPDLHTSGFDGDRLPAGIETTIYRIVQEALHNVAQHARAGTVSIIVTREASEVSAIVEDDGVGFDATVGRKPDQLGLLGMNERALLAGGTVCIESSPGRGTTVILRIPLPR